MVRKPLIFSLPAPLEHAFMPLLRQAGLLTQRLGDADYLILPFGFEFYAEFSAVELSKHGLGLAEQATIRQCVHESDKLAQSTGKPLLVIHYRDDASVFSLANAMVFRTSGYRSRTGTREYGLPAFVDHLPGNKTWYPLAKPSRPFISFRGQCAPLRLSPTLMARRWANHLFENAGLTIRVKEYYNEGYLLRRRAVLALQKSAKNIDLDFVFNPSPAQPEFSSAYLQSFQQAPYFLVAAGHGNYSFRLYEVMREGRIPVLLDTEGLMPCADIIDWENLVIWVDKKEVDRLPEMLLEKHHATHPDDFLAWQEKIRDTYNRYLTVDGFFNYWVSFLGEQTGK